MPYPRISHRIKRFVLAFCVLLFIPMLFASKKNFVKPVAQPAKTYPAHDGHPDEKVTIAADPYDTPDKAKIFSIDFQQAGFLPIFFIVTNDGDQPVSIAKMQITLITANHSKLTPTSPEDIYRRLSDPQAQTRPSPFPIPRSKVKGTVGQRERDEIESSQFEARAVEPHGTQSGFLFFDVGGITSPLAGANLDITGVDDVKGSELMYFEISMPKDNGASSKP
jgi:hypothetical protein